MTREIVETTRVALDSIARAYGENFAGRPRGACDRNAIDALLDRARVLNTELAAVPAEPAITELRAEVAKTFESLKRERDAVHEAHRAGPDYDTFARLASQANVAIAAYRRHFVRQPRATRDVGFLDEIQRDLSRYHVELKAIAKRHTTDGQPSQFAADVDAIGAAIATCRAEHEAIVQTQNNVPQAERPGLYAELANAQFDWYERLFAGNSRITRRPGLLRRMVQSLRAIEDQLSTLARQGGGGWLERDLAVVRDRRAAFSQELDAINTDRARVGHQNLAAALGGAANQVFEIYAREFGGRPRRMMNLERLGNLCDELGEISRQMDELRANGMPENERNLDLVLDQLLAFEREYELIAESRQLG